ncbi:MAG: methionine--tRNA ligase subunit beta, partial [Desulfocapsaceae bacterium]|nr:methionine--tRNA ligase subunit beta [Desulfocapsaceae bacterium]
YAKLHVHGYWNVDETKMSKSIGNVVRPRELVEKYGRDPLRYFILREMSFGLDASFGHDAIIARMNSDLANDLGNLFSRSLAMLHKYRDGIVPSVVGSPEEIDVELKNSAEKMLAGYRENMDGFAFHRALQAVWELVSQLNKYIVNTEPWALAKDESKRGRLDTVLYNLLESLRLIGLVLSPIMPETAEKIMISLGLEGNKELCLSWQGGAGWGFFPIGQHVQQAEPLFPRVEVKKERKKEQANKNKNKQEPAAQEGLITFDQFKKTQLKVAEILTAERVEGSERLLQLTVEAHERRTVVAGIAEHYRPEDLIGKQVVFVANLKPAKIMGLRSEGMLLAAKTKENGKERLVLTTVSAPVENGSIVA